mgnify:CR=1 FL=1
MDQDDATIVTKVTFDRSKEGDYAMSIEKIGNDHVSLPIMVLTQDMLSTFETPHEEYYNQLGYTKIQWKTAAALPPFIHKMQTTGYSGSEFKTLTGSAPAWLGEDDILKFADKCEIILIDLERESSASGPQKGSGKRTSKKKKRRSKKRKPTKKRKTAKKRKSSKKRRRN